VRLLDVFCGAGGAGEGYRRVGFHVTGVDNQNFRGSYPGFFMQADALQILADLEFVRTFDLVHASPPCQARSDLQRQSKIRYTEYVPAVRELLKLAGVPYVIENVEGTPEDPAARLRDPIMLCGTMFPGLRVIRHRLFESNVPLTAPLHPPGHPLVFTHDKRKGHYGKLDQATAFVQVTGGGNATVANKRAAMGIDWMTGPELNEAIPPAYTEWIGAQVADHLRLKAVA
jgi:DNA (cytosine-5)-methyltransferase 1